MVFVPKLLTLVEESVLAISMEEIEASGLGGPIGDPPDLLLPGDKRGDSTITKKIYLI